MPASTPAAGLPSRASHVGHDKVIRLIIGLATKGLSSLRNVRLARINDVPGFLLERPGGEVATIAFDFRDGQITGIYRMLNPDKLRHVHAVS